MYSALGRLNTGGTKKANSQSAGQAIRSSIRSTGLLSRNETNTNNDEINNQNQASENELRSGLLGNADARLVGDSSSLEYSSRITGSLRDISKTLYSPVFGGSGSQNFQNLFPGVAGLAAGGTGMPNLGALWQGLGARPRAGSSEDGSGGGGGIDDGGGGGIDQGGGGGGSNESHNGGNLVNGQHSFAGTKVNFIGDRNGAEYGASVLDRIFRPNDKGIVGTASFNASARSQSVDEVIALAKQVGKGNNQVGAILATKLANLSGEARDKVIKDIESGRYSNVSKAINEGSNWSGGNSKSKLQQVVNEQIAKNPERFAFFAGKNISQGEIMSFLKDKMNMTGDLNKASIHAYAASFLTGNEILNKGRDLWTKNGMDAGEFDKYFNKFFNPKGNSPDAIMKHLETTVHDHYKGQYGEKYEKFRQEFANYKSTLPLNFVSLAVDDHNGAFSSTNRFGTVAAADHAGISRMIMVQGGNTANRTGDQANFGWMHFAASDSGSLASMDICGHGWATGLHQGGSGGGGSFTTADSAWVKTLSNLVAKDSFVNVNLWACSNASGGSGSNAAMVAASIEGAISRGSTVPTPIQRESFTIVDGKFRSALELTQNTDVIGISDATKTRLNEIHNKDNGEFTNQIAGQALAETAGKKPEEIGQVALAKGDDPDEKLKQAEQKTQGASAVQ